MTMPGKTPPGIAAGMLAANGNKLDKFTAVPEAGFTKEETRGSYYDETPYVDRWLIRRAMQGRLPDVVLTNIKGVRSPRM